MLMEYGETMPILFEVRGSTGVSTVGVIAWNGECKCSDRFLFGPNRWGSLVGQMLWQSVDSTSTR